MGMSGVEPSTKNDSLLKHLEHIRYHFENGKVTDPVLKGWINGYLERVPQAGLTEKKQARSFLETDSASLNPLPAWVTCLLLSE